MKSGPEKEGQVAMFQVDTHTHTQFGKGDIVESSCRVSALSVPRPGKSVRIEQEVTYMKLQI